MLSRFFALAVLSAALSYSSARADSIHLAAAVTVTSPSGAVTTNSEVLDGACCRPAGAQFRDPNDTVNGALLGQSFTLFGQGKVEAQPPNGWTVAAYSLWSDEFVVHPPPPPPCTGSICPGPIAPFFTVQFFFKAKGTLSTDAIPTSAASVLFRYMLPPQIIVTPGPPPPLWDPDAPDFFATSPSGGTPLLSQTVSSGGTSASFDEELVISSFAIYNLPIDFQALLEVHAANGGIANFFDTVTLTKIVIPTGATLTSASGALYPVNVPEPSTWVLLLGGGLFVAVRRRRERRAGR
jgi:PEP-CTERM motif